MVSASLRATRGIFVRDRREITVMSAHEACIIDRYPWNHGSLRFLDLLLRSSAFAARAFKLIDRGDRSFLHGDVCRKFFVVSSLERGIGERVEVRSRKVAIRGRILITSTRTSVAIGNGTILLRDDPFFSRSLECFVMETSLE